MPVATLAVSGVHVLRSWQRRVGGVAGVQPSSSSTIPTSAAAGVASIITRICNFLERQYQLKPPHHHHHHHHHHHNHHNHHRDELDSPCGCDRRVLSCHTSTSRARSLTKALDDQVIMMMVVVVVVVVVVMMMMINSPTAVIIRSSPALFSHVTFCCST